MARKPTPSAGNRLSNIISTLTGNIDLSGLTTQQTLQTSAYGKKSLLSDEIRSKILTRNEFITNTNVTRTVTPESIFRAALGSTSRGRDLSENRMILNLLPDVNKAVKLMIASIISPNDLSLQEFHITVDVDSVDENTKDSISEFASKFFEEKLNLRINVPTWIKEFGYTDGSTVIAIIPMQTFSKMEDKDFGGLESSVELVADKIVLESLFGFSDTPGNTKRIEEDHKDISNMALEAMIPIIEEINSGKLDTDRRARAQKVVKENISKFIGSESLSLTDNPHILNLDQYMKKRKSKKRENIIRDRFVKLRDQTVVGVDSSEETLDSNSGDPIFLKIPTEAVTVIHTPGDPTDHQGYLVLLNRNGNPVNVNKDLSEVNTSALNLNYEQQDIFHQTANAYGVNISSTKRKVDKEAISDIYNQVIRSHLQKRLSKTGLDNVDINISDSVYRCMFSRYLQNKHTRVLFLPKELVTYMTFSYDDYGNGVSKLEGIKFYLGLKMAVQVSKVLAAIKAAADNRNIAIKFTDNLMDSPESIISSVIREYVNKSVMSFSIDPNQIQSQIIDKSLTIKGTGIPGMEDFEITNEPDSKTGSFNFDEDLLKDIDKSILNGLGVPASAMNSLNEDEYSRSVVTTNLFFAMDVSVEQRVVIKHISDLLRKYARFSQTFIEGVTSKLTTDNEDKGSISSKNEEIEKIIEGLSFNLPKPNIAPSKAQFESLEAMSNAITTMINSIFPDDMAGTDDEIGPIIRLVRSKFIAENITNYLDNSGLNGIDVPKSDFTNILKSISDSLDGLENIRKMIEEKKNISSSEAKPEPGY